jgi:hypothetical protein
MMSLLTGGAEDRSLGPGREPAGFEPIETGGSSPQNKANRVCPDFAAGERLGGRSRDKPLPRGGKSATESPPTRRSGKSATESFFTRTCGPEFAPVHAHRGYVAPTNGFDRRSSPIVVVGPWPG